MTSSLSAESRERVDAWNEQNPGMQDLFRKAMADDTLSDAERQFVDEWCLSRWEGRPMTFQSVDDVLEQVSQRDTEQAARLAGARDNHPAVCVVPKCGKEARHRGRHANQGDRYKKVVTEADVPAIIEAQQDVQAEPGRCFCEHPVELCTDECECQAGPASDDRPECEYPEQPCHPDMGEMCDRCRTAERDPEPDTGFTTLERVFLFWLLALSFLVLIVLVVK